jgi:arsenite transporter
MVVRIVLGKLLSAPMADLCGIEFGAGSEINAPVAGLIWLMITPTMMKVDFSSVGNMGKHSVNAGLAYALMK